LRMHHPCGEMVQVMLESWNCSWLEGGRLPADGGGHRRQPGEIMNKKEHDGSIYGRRSVRGATNAA